jgi:hypothetical protein
LGLPPGFGPASRDHPKNAGWKAGGRLKIRPHDVNAAAAEAS